MVILCYIYESDIEYCKIHTSRDLRCAPVHEEALFSQHRSA